MSMNKICNITIPTYPTSHSEYGQYVEVSGVYLDTVRYIIIVNFYDRNRVWYFTELNGNQVDMTLDQVNSLDATIMHPHIIRTSMQVVSPDIIIRKLKEGTILRVDAEQLHRELDVQKYIWHD